MKELSESVVKGILSWILVSHANGEPNQIIQNELFSHSFMGRVRPNRNAKGTVGKHSLIIPSGLMGCFSLTLISVEHLGCEEASLFQFSHHCSSSQLARGGQGALQTAKSMNLEYAKLFSTNYRMFNLLFLKEL